jgi:ABC-2 type transport system ATP-binding protein
MIQVSQLTKKYGARTAIQDLNFEVNAGEIVGFLGFNGAGKSTTMKILSGFMPASSGRASVAGFDVFERALDVKRNVGYLPETPPVYNEMLVQDYVEYAAKLNQVPASQLRAAVSSALEKTGLGDVRRRLIGNLSKGYRQRVGLAQALVHNPKVLILDEPTVGLDPKQIKEIRDLIRGLAGDHTVILSSHILPEIKATCERIIVIHKGRIKMQGTVDSLTSQVKGGLLYSMTVRNAVAPAIDAIRKIEGVNRVEVAGPRLDIELSRNAPDMRDRIVETAVSQRMGVLEFRSEELSLEEVFLRLTSEEEQTQ